MAENKGPQPKCPRCGEPTPELPCFHCGWEMDPAPAPLTLTNVSASGKIHKMTFWTCPCGYKVHRSVIRQPREGSFPDDYDYTVYQSNDDFLLKIIEHLCTHIKER